MLVIILLLALAYSAWRLFHILWWRPKQMERFLRQQGLSGNSYKSPYGDYLLYYTMEKESRDMAIQVSQNLLPKTLSFIYKSVQTHGKKCFMWMGPLPVVVIGTPNDLRDIFSKHQLLEKLNSDVLVRYVAVGLLSYTGDKWLRHRRSVDPAFHVSKLKDMIPAFHLSCCEMLSEWDKLVRTNGPTEIDVMPFFEFMSGDALCRAVFGRSYKVGRRIFLLQKELGQHATKEVVNIYNIIPGWRFVPTKAHRRMEKINNELKTLIKELINEKKEMQPTTDLLGMLLQSNAFTTDEIVEDCKLFFSAGQETTSSLLAWTMVLLSHYTDWQVLARDEVLKVFGTATPHFDGLKRLQIVKMIIYEVLRLFPPAVSVLRYARKDTKVGGMCLPAGTIILLPTAVVHRDTEFWGEDANEFNPSRFAKGIANATKARTLFFPFGSGPRICIGQNFAIIQAQLTIAMILQRFTFKLSPNYCHSPSISFILKPKDGAEIILSRI